MSMAFLRPRTAPSTGGCRNYTSHRVIAYYLDDAKGGSGASHGGDRPVSTQGALITALPPVIPEMV